MCRTIFNQNVTLPVPVNIVCLFVTYLHVYIQLGSATIATYLSAISFLHKINQMSDPCTNFVVHKLQQACAKRSSATSPGRLPITLPLLHKLLSALPLVQPILFRQILFKAMFLIAFHACCRVGELTKSGQAQHWLKLHDISFANQSVTVTSTSYKHCKPGYVPKITVHATGNQYCPVMALKAFLSIRGTQPGPLFCMSDNLPITRHMFCKVLNQCVSFLGLNSAQLTSHSFRIGRATLGLEQGLTIEQIRLMGRWHSDAFRKYLKPTEVHV